jgi:hypothetical protein
MFNQTTLRPTSIDIFLADPLFLDTALAALTSKYGKPDEDKTTAKVNRQGGPYEFRSVAWTHFKDGAVHLTKSERDLLLTISYSVNKEAAAPPKVDF